MSPEIMINGKLVADVPDKTGSYQMLDGSPLYVDVSRIEARNSRQVIVLDGPVIGGRRVIGLSQEGKGDTNNPKRKGDRKDPALAVILHDRPIRISYRNWREVNNRSLAEPRGRSYVLDKRTYYNPRWIRR